MSSRQPSGVESIPADVAGHTGESPPQSQVSTHRLAEQVKPLPRLQQTEEVSEFGCKNNTASQVKNGRFREWLEKRENSERTAREQREREREKEHEREEHGVLFYLQGAIVTLRGQIGLGLNVGGAVVV